MNDEPPAKSSHTAAWSAVIVALPLMYVLSIGPVAYLAHKLGMYSAASGLAQAFYAPVIWLHDHTVCKAPLESYLDWWERLGEQR